MSNSSWEDQPGPDQSPLAWQVEKLLRKEADLLPRNALLRPLHKEIDRCHERLRLPVRVAIVGRIKAGKSTLMNALLGEVLVPTGAVEATFNVNWFHYGETPELRIHFRDGRPPETRPFTALDEVTRRSAEHMESLLEIAQVEVLYPAKMLRALHLVDTPGLASTYEDDSENTLRFLQLHGAELTAITQAEAASADATLYLFSQGVSETDLKIVEEFLGGMGSRLTPLNALGVLTRADDNYWKPPDPNIIDAPTSDPLDEARTIIQRLMQDSRLRNAFYALYPVCGLVGEGATTLTDEEFASLERLVRSPQDRVAALLMDAPRFHTREAPDILATLPERQALLKRLGQYGVWLACERLKQLANQLAYERMRQELPTPVEITEWLLEHNAKVTEWLRVHSAEVTEWLLTHKAGVVEWLLTHSGVPEIRERILSHFGNRAALIKVAAVLTSLRDCWQQICGDLVERDLAAGLRFIGALEKLEQEEHAFQELRVLRDYYEGRLKLSQDETRHLLAVTGEQGLECYARLEAAPDTSLAALRALSEKHITFWAHRATIMLDLDGTARRAATIIKRSYEHIRHRIVRAESELATAANGFANDAERDQVLHYLNSGACDLPQDACAELEAMTAPQQPPWMRLGHPEEAPLEVLIPLAVARRQRWYEVTNDYLSFSSRTRAIARIQARAYEGIEAALRRAFELLAGYPF